MHVLIKSALATPCDRVVVFRQGTIRAELSGEDRSQQIILEAMNSGSEANLASTAGRNG